MKRRKRHHEEDHENHERWLVSYADFITLLFAFFVVMYSISSVNEGKYRVLSDTLGVAFTGGVAPQNIPVSKNFIQKTESKTIVENSAVVGDRKKLTHIASDLKKLLAPLVKDGQVRVTQSVLGVSVEINASVLFMPGEAVLSEKSKQVLLALAAALQDDTHLVQIEGHTDSKPIANSLFASNWELSAVRASSVARLFVSQGMDEQRLTVIGHGSNKPVVANDTDEGRMRNRRVTVMILPKKTSEAVEVAIPD